MIKRFDKFIDAEVERYSDHIELSCTGSDPQCQLAFDRALKPGWYNFEYLITIAKGRLINPKLYFDIGRGYNERDVILLPVINGKSVLKTVYFSKKIYRLRFDPTEDKYANFSIYNFFIERLPILKILKKLSSSNAENLSKSKIQRYLSSIGIVLKKDVRKIEKLLSIKANDPFNYQNWIGKYDSYTLSKLSEFEHDQLKFEYRPLISILLPTYNTCSHWLKSCIESILNQVYDNWELCIADDGSTNSQVRNIIKESAQKNHKVKYTFLQKNAHIAAASNVALSLSTGEFITFLDHDDMLHPLALYRIAEALNEDKTIDFLYSDEDKIDARGQRTSPFFKPDWSPALFSVQNYIAHLSCIRKTFIEDVNGFSKGVDGSQDYDLFLKVCVKHPKIKHLPFVLYHWRQHGQSTSLHSNAKIYAHTAGKKSLELYLTEKYPQQFSHIEELGQNFIYKPRFIFEKTNKVSIIIPTKDKVEYLEPCIKSITKRSTWRNYEIIILNNNSCERKTLRFFEKIQREDERIKVIDAPFSFNWSKLNNFGAKHASGNYLIFLNNDISVITPSWIEELCEWAGLPEVGTVGTTLLYRDKTIQHAGVVIGMNGWADHIYKNVIPQYYSSPFVSNNIPRNVLANTGACVAIEKKKFEQLGGFDETFIICGSDVELGIRAYKFGLFSVLNAYVQLFHYESKSRGTAIPDNDFVQSALKYEPYRTLQCDPFYNPNLSLNYTFPICKS
ncbi:MAG TPA: glycosyltransferase [Chitinophagaceae bacterium]|jgi:glycosyltransferase involved in cell wall biosynthesis|nr:glycosyltransferase [Chitinophagaceae bacterium]